MKRLCKSRIQKILDIVYCNTLEKIFKMFYIFIFKNKFFDLSIVYAILENERSFLHIIDTISVKPIN